MSLPVSQYEALLAEVRGLRQKAQRVQQLATPLITNSSSDTYLTCTTITCSNLQNDDINHSLPPHYKMKSHLMEREHKQHSLNYDRIATGGSVEGDTICSEDEYGLAQGSSHNSINSEPISHKEKYRREVSSLYHGTWPVEGNMWNSEPTSIMRTSPPILNTSNNNINSNVNNNNNNNNNMEVTSVMSFASSSGAVPLERVLCSPSLSRRSSQQLEAKVDMVYSLLAMLGGQDQADMGETLLSLSSNPESCLAMRQSGCIPLLVQLIQSDKQSETRLKASQALNNLVHSQTDEKLRKREIRILKLLEQTRIYIDALKNNKESEFILSISTLSSSSSTAEDDGKHPIQTIAHLMKLSFDEGHRQVICQLGGIHTIASLVEAEHNKHGSINDETHCILMRRYACMALTNLTFGDSGNKALLCSFKDFMKTLVIQLKNPSDELRQVTASVLRNLSWRADSSSKEILREVGSVTGLMKAAMLNNKENTLKSILSALWNLSAHCTDNKAEICAIENALGFLIDLLTYKAPSKSLAIIENSGGILRNISSQIAVRDDYRQILRQHNCLQILLDQLKSPSLTIVSNACGTLWNLSAKCVQDQEILWELGAPQMLRSLNHSKHKMIAMGSSAALKNLLSARPTQTLTQQLDSTALAMDLTPLPTLGVRKQKALLNDLDQTLSETYENIEKDSPIKIPINKIDGRFLKNNSYEDDYLQFSSLNEPSTSYNNTTIISTNNEIGKSKHDCSLSLPYMGPSNSSYSSSSSIKNQNIQNEDNLLFTKLPKNYTKNKKSTNENENLKKSLKQSTELDDNEILIENKHLKEITIVNDEKDHCSIEDSSDTDTQKISDDTSLDYLKNSYLINNVKNERKEILIFSLSSSDDDYSRNNLHNISASSGLSLEESTEKQDNDNEKFTIENDCGNKIFSLSQINCQNNGKLIGSGIPLPRSLPRAIPGASTSQRNDSGIDVSLPIESDNDDLIINGFSKCSGIYSSTPHNNKCIDNNIQRKNGSSEALKVSINDINRLGIDVSPPHLLNNCAENQPSSDNITTQVGSNQLEINKQNTTDESIEMNEVQLENKNGTLVVSCSSSFDNGKDIDSCLERSCEETNRLDNRMLDPDAMIESLDRFTAELVSQASHLQKCDEKYKISSGNDNTWTENSTFNTIPSLSGSPPNVVTFSDEHDKDLIDGNNNDDDDLINIDSGQPSNDYSSINTTTMTESTLIAMEATKIATVFRNEAEMSQSITSISSLDLDKVQPPSLTTNNSICFDKIPTNSPKSMYYRKKSLPLGLMAKRALCNPNGHGSLENLESHSLLEQMNPPSLLNEVLDLEGSLSSIASLPSSENIDKVNFQINGIVNKNNLTPTNKQFLTSNFNNSIISDIENMNPPSIFNEITDLCNSLADVTSDAIETETYEDCFTHVPDDDLTEFSDAINQNTPIQSDFGSSSAESTPKKPNKIKQITSKQRRNFARDRYKTYTVAAEMLMKNDDLQLQSISDIDDEFKTITITDNNNFESVIDDDPTTYVSPTYTINNDVKLTPKQKRQANSKRFETQVIDSTILEELKNIQVPPTIDNPRTKLSIKRNFLQKRMENKERFKTQTLDEFSFPAESSTLINNNISETSDSTHYLLQKEANLVLKNLQDTKIKPDDNLLLDCETLSLVSNDDDFENNSVNSINYRTYRKSGICKKNIPIVETQLTQTLVVEKPPNESSDQDDDYDEEQNNLNGKPKIVKPADNEIIEEIKDEPTKAIRGRRKPLYSRTNLTSIKPIQKITSNLLRNVTPTFKSGNLIKPPQNRTILPGSSKLPAKTGSSKTAPSSPHKSASHYKPPVERQGTFTKDDIKSKTIPCNSRIPSSLPPSKIAKPSSMITKIPSQVPLNKQPSTSKNLIKSSSSDRATTRTNNINKIYTRSTSADNTIKVRNSPSTQSLKTESSSKGAVKKSSIPTITQRSNSNTSLNGTTTIPTKKQVTSKIASLWKKIEESKKQPIKKDTRVWIQHQNIVDDVKMRNKNDKNDDTKTAIKRVSRLGSFIVMDDDNNDDNMQLQQIINTNVAGNNN